MFAAAPTVAPKKSKKDREEIDMGNDLNIFSGLAALITTLKATQTIYEAKLKTKMTNIFAEKGLAQNKRPANWHGTSSLAEASMQLKCRASSSILTTEEVKALQEAGITVNKKEISPERFLFNQAILSNPDLRAKVSAALSLIEFGDIQPILHEAAVEQYVVEDGTLDQVFQLAKTQEKAESLLPFVSVLAIKPSFKGGLKDATNLLIDAGIRLEGEGTR
jgi:hypothetical protein